MGQYWKVFNLDKKECLHPHRFDDGLKFCEFTRSEGGTMSALAVLLAAPESMGHGGGDDKRSEMTGRWAGDRIAIIGDYNDDERWDGAYEKTFDQDGKKAEYLDISNLFLNTHGGF